MSRTRWIVLFTSLALTSTVVTYVVTEVPAGATAGGNGPQHYVVGLFGDMPYGDAGRAQYPNVIADMNTQNLAFSVFDGDIKNGSEPCYADVDGSAQAAGKPDIYRYARNLFMQQRNPVVVVPGDNEWTDCDRPATKGPVFDAVDRLGYERTVLYDYDPATGRSNPNSLGQRTIAITRQSDVDPSYQYPENARWTWGPVTYVGLNVPGSNNDWINDGDTTNGPVAEAQAEYTARNAANLAWLSESFAAAKAAGSKAVMIVLQADMFGPGSPFPTTTDPTDHFADTRNAIADAAIAFGGPVVVVNGDSHSFNVDKPFTDAQGNVIENLTRVTTFGSAQNHWVTATVDPTDPDVFSFEQHLITANEPTYTAP
jgi:hypothetical protein